MKKPPKALVPLNTRMAQFASLIESIDGEVASLPQGDKRAIALAATQQSIIKSELGRLEWETMVYCEGA